MKVSLKTEKSSDQKVVNMITFLYKGQQLVLLLECEVSELLTVNKVVRQGRILSPHMFSL